MLDYDKQQISVFWAIVFLFYILKNQYEKMFQKRRFFAVFKG